MSKEYVYPLAWRVELLPMFCVNHLVLLLSKDTVVCDRWKDFRIGALEGVSESKFAEDISLIISMLS